MGFNGPQVKTQGSPCLMCPCRGLLRVWKGGRGGHGLQELTKNSVLAGTCNGSGGAGERRHGCHQLSWLGCMLLCGLKPVVIAGC